MRFLDTVLGSAAGLLATQAANGASLCIAPADSGAVTWRCGQVTTRPMGWMGFTTAGVPCWDFPTEQHDFVFCNPPDCYVPGENDFEFGWSISASKLDPRQTTAAIGGAQTLYLWFECTMWHLQAGLEAATFALVGDITVDSLRTTNGFLNGGTDTEPFLVVGNCPVGPVIAAEIHVVVPTPVESDSWGRIKAGYAGRSSRP
jgi:hypothetical protein